jgi:hypothetical protein
MDNKKDNKNTNFNNNFHNQNDNYESFNDLIINSKYYKETNNNIRENKNNIYYDTRYSYFSNDNKD